MAQHGILIPSGLDGGTFRDEVNEAHAALATFFHGTVDPTSIPGVAEYVTPGFAWLDSSISPVELKLRNGADDGWLTIARLTGTSVAGGESGWSGSDIGSQLAGKLPLAGGTMTGPIELAADPVSAMQPGTKQYIDGVSRPSSQRWCVQGTLAPITGVIAAVIEQDCKLKRIYAHAETAPTGASIEVAVVKNGSGSSQVTILPGTNAGLTVLGSPTSLVAGDRLRLDIIGVGSVEPGGNPLLVSCFFEAP